VPATAGDAARLLAPWRERVAALGGVERTSAAGALALAVGSLLPDARRSALGRMQRPPLDGPVDLRPAATSSRA
jgi:hypothetical protein